MHAHPLSLYLPSRKMLRCTLQLRGQMHPPYFYTTPICTLCIPSFRLYLYMYSVLQIFPIFITSMYSMSLQHYMQLYVCAFSVCQFQVLSSVPTVLYVYAPGPYVYATVCTSVYAPLCTNTIDVHSISPVAQIFDFFYLSCPRAEI